MSSSVTLTSAVRSNLLALQGISGQQATTQERLATGKKVNSALDNPTNYFTAASLTARAGELGNLLDSMTNGINTLKAADNGLTSITTTIQSMEATVTQARQDASWQSSSFTLDSSAVGTTSLKNITFTGGSIGSSTISVALNDQEKLAGASAFTGGSNSTGTGTTGTLTIQAADINGGTAVTVNVAGTDTSSTVAANINAAVGYTLASSTSTTLTLQDAGANKITVGGTAGVLTGAGLTTTTSTATVGAQESVDQIASAINSNTSLSGLVKATDNAGQLQITNLSISGLTVGGINSGNGSLDGSTTGTSSIGGNTTRASLVTQFNQLKDQLDKTAQDSSFNGINLLNGDQLKLEFNELSTSSLTIQSTNTSGINSSTLGVTDGTNAEFQTNSSLDSRLTQLQTAVTTVASQASAFGNNLSIVQNRQDFTNNMINTLQTGSDGLTLADTNLEGANMLALQTQQQLSVQSLSLASQANQAVLRLFG
jgi:flagellin-like hook-associated protein FlgL